MTRRGRILSFGLAALLVVVGVVIAAAIESLVAQVVGLVLSGIGLVLATSLVFFEVGLSEDRERAREQAAREAATREAEAQEGEAREGEAREGEAREGEAREGEAREVGTHDHALQRRRRAPLPRARGQRRRLK